MGEQPKSQIMSGELRKPPSTVTRINEPNMELMARAFRNLYHKSLKKEAQASVKVGE